MTPADGLRKVLLCTEAALGKKAADLVVIDVADLTSIAEHLIVCSGRSDRQVQAISEEIARALCAYDAREVELIKGQRTPRIEPLLGYSNGDAVVHRDDLVLV